MFCEGTAVPRLAAWYVSSGAPSETYLSRPLASGRVSAFAAEVTSETTMGRWIASSIARQRSTRQRAPAR